MPNNIGKLQAAEDAAAKIEEQINLLKGSVKVDTKEASNHAVILKGLGDYAELRQLIAGDYAFFTRFNKTARIEHKTWDGLIGDIGTHRIADQLRRQEKDISILLIEGWLTTGHGGTIRTQTKEYRHRPFVWLWNYILSIQLAGVYVYISPNEYLTAKIILSIFDYLNKEEHTALSQRQKLISMHPGLSPKQVGFSTIPTIGTERAKAIDKHFHSSWVELCNASVEEITAIEGIGEKRANLVYKFIRNLI